MPRKTQEDIMTYFLGLEVWELKEQYEKLQITLISVFSVQTVSGLELTHKEQTLAAELFCKQEP